MTSMYSIISIETRLVTHFSGYKTITLHEKAMLYVLNHDFHFSFCIGYSDMLNEVKTIVYSLCFKKKTLEILLHLSFKEELPTGGL